MFVCIAPCVQVRTSSVRRLFLSHSLQLGSLTSSVTSRRYWVVLRKETAHSSQSRLQLYRSEDQVDLYLNLLTIGPSPRYPTVVPHSRTCSSPQVYHGDPHREISLEEVRSLHQLDSKKSFAVILPTTSLLFMCASRADLQVPFSQHACSELRPRPLPLPRTGCLTCVAFGPTVTRALATVIQTIPPLDRRSMKVTVCLQPQSWRSSPRPRAH